MRRPEILAPAGSTESVYAAVRCGADGVYVGGRDFSARASAVNLSDEELQWAADYCHLHGVKIYRAMNTMLFDRELPEFIRQLMFTAGIGFDGVIIQDIGGGRAAAQAVPGLPRHASTQMTFHTPEGAELARKMGYCRVVPARELSAKEIGDICSRDIQTEAFVHGAMCMCLSGQCCMSAVIGSRSANRGRCAQSCRLPISAEGAQECHALSLKDMSLISHAGELSRMGVYSLKIEGRMKRPEYVAAAVTALRHALENDNEDNIYAEGDMERLRSVFSRSGFTDGYFTGKRGQAMFGSRTKEDVTAAQGVLAELSALYREEKKDGVIDFALTVRPGEAVRLDFSVREADNSPDSISPVISGSVSGDIPEAAMHREFTAEDGKKYLAKLGDTRYIPGNITCDIAPGLALSAAAVNGLRRQACSEADRLTVEKFTPHYELSRRSPEQIAEDITRVSRDCPPSEKCEIRAAVYSVKAAMAAEKYADRLLLPCEMCLQCVDMGLPAEKLIARLPDIVTDEISLISQLKGLCEKGVTHFFAGNLTHIGTLSAVEKHCPGKVHIHGGWGLNAANSASLSVLAEMGLQDVCLSYEMKAGQISAIGKPLPVGIYAYGRLPLMTVRNCPVKSERGGCKDCPHRLCDPAGRVFPVYCSSDKSYARVLNCDILDVCDRLADFPGISFIIADLAGEEPEDTGDILSRCKRGEKPVGKYTRGLYYRGIK